MGLGACHAVAHGRLANGASRRPARIALRSFRRTWSALRGVMAKASSDGRCAAGARDDMASGPRREIRKRVRLSNAVDRGPLCIEERRLGRETAARDRRGSGDAGRAPAIGGTPRENPSRSKLALPRHDAQKDQSETASIGRCRTSGRARTLAHAHAEPPAQAPLTPGRSISWRGPARGASRQVRDAAARQAQGVLRYTPTSNA